MCCFSQPVNEVADTRIFARFVRPGVQALVYQMRYQSRSATAMILPVPTRNGVQNENQKPLRFVSLEHYPDFFVDMERGFPQREPPPAPLGGTPVAAGGGTPLPVENVGQFVASFVPSVRDFARLDPQFRLPVPTWNQLPEYRDWGFAVFQLRSTPVTPQSPHPMAFTFASRFTDRLFFPTVHIHDGKVHRYEDFDHKLYVQDDRLTAPDETDLPGFRRPVVVTEPLQASLSIVGKFVDTRKTQGLVDGFKPAYKRELHGKLPNQDTYIGV
jgi:hypothetical protein